VISPEVPESNILYTKLLVGNSAKATCTLVVGEMLAASQFIVIFADKILATFTPVGGVQLPCASDCTEAMQSRSRANNVILAMCFIFIVDNSICSRWWIQLVVFGLYYFDKAKVLI
jgi:hypothetical protein